MIFAIYTLLMLGVGGLIGFITMKIKTDKPSKGTLYVFENDELYLELACPIEDVKKNTTITLDIDVLTQRKEQ